MTKTLLSLMTGAALCGLAVQAQDKPKTEDKPVSNSSADEVAVITTTEGTMEGAVLKEARTKNKAALIRFQHEVQNRIDAGIPLLWSVQLGLVPERGIPQGAGGHMRLIIGYNSKTEEILYSDSWGAGHELKKMKADDAWTITTGLMTIEPLT